MRKLFSLLTLSAALLMSFSATAEYANYGSIELNGLARTSFADNPRGISSAMICNVNGPDGFLTIRSCSSTDCKSKRKLNRLAIVEIDTRQVKGKWVKVVTAGRTHTKHGRPQAFKKLHVTGWAHTSYLCDFIDY